MAVFASVLNAVNFGFFFLADHLATPAKVFLTLFALPLTYLVALPPVTSASLELILFALALLRKTVDRVAGEVQGAAFHQLAQLLCQAKRDNHPHTLTPHLVL